jgi:hypothetical protein
MRTDAIAISLFLFLWGGVKLNSLLLRPLIAPVPDDDDDECGVIGGIFGRGNRNTRRKPVPVPFCPPQIPYDQTRARTLAAAVGSQRLSV